MALDERIEAADRLLGEGETLILVATDGQPVGVLTAADTARPSAARAIAGLLPEDKAGGVRPLQQGGLFDAMVGNSGSEVRRR